MRFVSQGTISILIGCHSFPHALFVIKAWRKIHKRWPKPWELFSILIHDIGHLGLNYLDDIDQKAQHWELGACIARAFVGQKGYDLVAGHSTSSKLPRSDLYLPDKISWAITPTWFLVLNAIAEPDLKRGASIMPHVRQFQEWVRKNMEREEPRETHNAVNKLADDRTRKDVPIEGGRLDS